MTVDLGGSAVRIDLDKLGFDPDVSAGDHVSVTGLWDDDLFEGLELEASSVIKLEQDSRKRSRAG